MDEREKLFEKEGYKMIQTRMIGQWQVNFSDEVVVLGAGLVSALDRLLNEKWLPIVREDYSRAYAPNLMMTRWGVPSLMVRLDMPPPTAETALVLPDGDRIPGFYEVEANPAGQGVTAMVADSDNSFIAPIVQALTDLGIGEIVYGFAQSRQNQFEDLRIFMDALRGHGIETHMIEEVEGTTRVPLWLRAGEEDFDEIDSCFGTCLLLHRDGGGHKQYLRTLTGAKLVAECDVAIARQFPVGFALKPVRGWGSRGVDIWSPLPAFKKGTTGLTKMERRIEAIELSGQQYRYLVQPFLPPQVVERGRFLIWRIFAIFTPSGYRVVGGAWSSRNSVKVHGASDTVMGLIRV